jgi:hypothetical protein
VIVILRDKYGVLTDFPGLDYKLLMDRNVDPLDVIEPILNQENVATIAKLASHIPNQVTNYQSIHFFAYVEI